MLTRRRLVIAVALVVLIGVPLLEEPTLVGARGVGYAVCHQLPTHSFFAAGEQLPLCARCTGIYLGFLVGIAGMALLGTLGAAVWPPTTVSTILMLSMALMVGDGFNSLTSALPEGFQVYQPTNLLRLATGISAGMSLSLLLVPLLNDSLWAKRELAHSVSGFRDLAGIYIIAALAAMLVYSEHPLILLPVTVLSALGVLATLGTAGTALAAALLRRERQCHTRLDAVPLFMVGVGLSIVLMAGLAALRYYYSVPVGI